MTTYTIDTAHSDVGFSVRHMMFARVRGHFTKWTATLTIDPTDPSRSSVDVTIDAKSIDTREPQRDAHLRSPDFLDADRYPTITFKSLRTRATGPNNYKVVGDLTIHGTTQEVELDVTETGRGKDPWGNERIGFVAKAAIDRSAFGLRWNQALEAGGVLVGDRVDIELDIQAVAAATKAA